MASNLLKTAIYPFVTLMASTVFIVSFVYTTSLLITKDTDIKKGVSVAHIEIGELPLTVANEKLEIEINNWKETNSVSFLYHNKEVTISNKELYFFDIEETLQNKSNKSEWPLHFYLNEEKITNELNDLLNENLYKSLNFKDINKKLSEYGDSLTNNDLTVILHDFLAEKTEVISTSEINGIFNTNNFIKAVFMFDGIEFAPKEQFSVADYLRKNVNDSINDQIYSIIASAIYEVILPTNFEIVERHTSDVLPAYSRLGFEAKVDRNKDLVFYNPNATAYLLHFHIDEDVLTTTLTGIPLLNTYQVQLSNQKITDYESKIETDMNSKGISVKQRGHIGQEVTVHRVVKMETGESKEQWISDDHYLPVTSIEIHGQAVKQQGGKGN